MMRRLAIVAWCALAGALVLGFFFFRGPRMQVQAHGRPYRFVRPPLPEGAVPVAPPRETPPVDPYARAGAPLPLIPETTDRGRTYYGYYCLACHGVNADGAGPVGESYVPQPANLRQANLARWRDEELLYRMMTGDGHAPALQSIVPPAHRPFLLAYLRSLTLTRTNAVPAFATR